MHQLIKTSRCIYASVNRIIRGKLNQEQTQSMLPCHHTILEVSITVATTPCHERAHATFCGRQSMSIELRQTRVIWLATMALIMQCVLHNYDIISMLEQGRMLFSGIACFMKIWCFFKWEFPCVLMMSPTTHAWTSYVSRCDISNKISIDLSFIKWVSVEYDESYHENIS